MFSIPTNFKQDISEELLTDNIYEIYGKLPRDLIGGGRPSYILPSISFKKLAEYIKKIHVKNIQFNYLLNSPSLQNIEYTQKGKQKIHKFLAKLVHIGVDTFTVTIPYLAQYIKERFPSVNINVSIIANVNNLTKVKYWENIGVDTLTLSLDLNRNFKELKAIKEKSQLKLKLLVNEGCLLSCIFRDYHHNVSSISSSNNHKNISNVIDYCTINCRTLYLNDFSNFIRAPWIRPEDIHQYKKIGIDYFKIIGRATSPARLKETVNAYTKGEYKGDLSNIVSFQNRPDKLSFKQNFSILYHLLKNHGFKISKILRAQRFKLNSYPPYIDNSKLDKFIDHFLNKKEHCCMNSPMQCNHCAIFAKKAIKIDKKEVDHLLANLEELRRILIYDKM
ncbi:MAG: U32 family peptidase [Candidatus Omnitrophica bacterium]|nr:U32 family peptidase [Candidatus Omnitrophota bacterium]